MRMFDSGVVRRLVRAGHRMAVCATLGGGLLAGGATVAIAAPQPAGQEPQKLAALPLNSQKYQLTFKQLGAVNSFQLRGIDGSNSVSFGVRTDQAVVAANLKLSFAHSPALLSNLSHLNILVNDQVAATIRLPSELASAARVVDVPLPPRYFSEFNRLTVQLIGHYTLECEDPAHSSLWANVSNSSSLELTVVPVALQNDLSLLPLPFFDRRDIRMLTLPVVFARASADDVIEPAGVVASWLGALAGFRGAKFPVSPGQLPAQGNAVVLGLSGQKIDSLVVPVQQGPSVSVLTNPNDANGKLLLIAGRDKADLRTAAAALTTGQQALSGQVAMIRELNQLKKREAYDAPNWLASGRRVRFGDLADSQSLNVSGYSPDIVRLNVNLPPDLFAWRNAGVPIHLKYRYTQRPVADKSSLNINVNNEFLKSLPLLPSVVNQGIVDQWLSKQLLSDNAPSSDTLYMPLYKLPAQSQLQFHYYFDYLKQGSCKDVVLDNVKGSIDPDSTLDLTGFQHFMEMPNLAVFANSGFPFTKFADLSETAVLMGESPTNAEYSALLGLMGRMGSSTGYPATALTVASAGTDMGRLSDKDLIVLGSPKTHSLLAKWMRESPVSFDSQGHYARLSDTVYNAFPWLKRFSERSRDEARLALSFNSDGADSLVSGFESPLKSGRSVVMLAASTEAGLNDISETLLDPELRQKVQGSAVLVRGSQVKPLLAESTYTVGSLDPVTWVRWQLAERPLSLVLMFLVASGLLAMLIYRALRYKAQKRLAG